MKKTINVKLVAAFCLAGTLAVAAASAVVPANTVVNANSGPTHWDGVTASGTIFSGDDCPIEVESEVLTFNINQLLDSGLSKEELLAYNANFCAEYTFKNPTQNTVNATLAFPLGEYSDFGYWENGEGGERDKYVSLDEILAAKNMYKVLVDGAQIKAETRYTFHELNDFDFSSESKRICEGYKSHTFFSPDTPVYKYTVRIIPEEEKADYFNAETVVAHDGGLRFGGEYGSLNKEKNGTQITYSIAENGEEIEMYSIGGAVDVAALEWRFYKYADRWNLVEKSVKARAVASDAVEQTTFKDYVLKGYSGGNDVSETEKSDFYNAVLDYIDFYLKSSMLPKNFAFLKNSRYLMRWLKYDLNFQAGQTVKNTVTAPLYSGGYYNYEPYVYNYYYLLSPAKNWNAFKSLEIRINTPYYLINSGLQFEKTEDGYVYKSNGLPDSELQFELCTVENPVKHVNHGYTVLAVIFIIVGFAVLLVPLVIAIIFIVWLVRRSKKGNDDADKGGKNGFKPMNTFDGGN